MRSHKDLLLSVVKERLGVRTRTRAEAGILCGQRKFDEVLSICLVF
jgi:hypothetical protein